MFSFYVYSRPRGEKRFLLTDIQRGTVGMKKIYAPRYPDAYIDSLIKALDYMATNNPGAIFQLRKLDGKTVVYRTACN